MGKLSKRILVAVILGAFMAPFLPAQAVTLEEIQAQINALSLQLQQLQTQSGAPAACADITFLRNLKAGSNGVDVKCLQQLLNQDPLTQVAVTGAGSKGNETVLFGSLTKLAVKKFQEKYASEILTPNGYARGTGMVGPATRAKLTALLASIQSAKALVIVPAAVAQKSQSELTQEVIAKATPAVVSVIIFKEVAQYEVVYENVFENGQGFSISTPVYRPTGKTVTQKIGAGSGFLITADGYVITNKHVVEDVNAIYSVMLATGTQQPAKVIYKDAAVDVAIIRIEGSGYPVLVLGDSSTLQLGQPIIAIGNALGEFANSVSLGIVSGLDRTINASDEKGRAQTLSGLIQTDAAIHQGNSGGPLLDLQANAVGINVAMVKGANNISFAIPINPVKTIVKTVLGI